jgi:hypothetical protein
MNRKATVWLAAAAVALAAVAAVAIVVRGRGDATAAPTELTEQRWEARAAAPIARTEVGAGVLDGRIWVLGGYTGDGDVAADVAVYDPAADAWETGPALPEAVHHTAVAGDGERLWVVGGYTTQDFARPTSAVRVIDAATGAWRDGPALPSPRAAGALAWDGERLVYGGGVGPDGVSGDVFVLEGEQWRRIGELSTAREHLAAASDGDGATWFLAGRVSGIDANLPDVDLVTGEQVERVGEIPTPRGGVAGFHAPGLGGCVVGGEEPGSTFEEVECVAADGTVAVLPPMGVSRHGLGAVAVDGVAYTLLGGEEAGLSVADAVEALNLKALNVEDGT